MMFDDEMRAASLYERICPFVPSRFKMEWFPVGVNERLRLYRYDVGQQFDWHQDGYFERESGERSFFTFMVYLNDGFKGGATSFRDDSAFIPKYNGLHITPETGMALLFHHLIIYRGDPVTEGRKYVLRSDIMYAKRTTTAAEALNFTRYPPAIQ